jgi:hypothetical protein
MTPIIPESKDARTITTWHLEKYRKMAAALGLLTEKYGDFGEWGFIHPAVPLDITLYVSELDCLWAGLQAVADFLAREGFKGKAGAP